MSGERALQPGLDLAVVGGGPVGVTMAILAARRGLTTAVFEKADDVYDLPRAVAMDDEIQRLLHSIGLGDELTELTTPLPAAEFVDTTGTRLSGVDLPLGIEWPLGHHPQVMYHQPDLERLLRRSALTHGVELRLGHAVYRVEQDSNHAWVDLQQPDGERVRQYARWVVGADGASSAVRKSLGISFDDAGFDQDWLVVDVTLRDPSEHLGLPTAAQQICDPDRPTTFIPGHGPYRRWEFQLQPGERPEEMINPERVWSMLKPWLSSEHGTLGRAVVYRFHATVAARMRERRVFLAGDAAHQMPPFMGQGLCSGLRDAANLCWKFSAVKRGVAQESLLDTYDDERRPHAYETVAYAVEVGQTIDRLAGRTDPDEQIALDVAYSGARPFPRLTAGLVTGDHRLVGRQLPQPPFAGAPLDQALGDEFALLVHDPGDVPAETLDQWSAIGARLVTLDDGGPATFLVPPGGVAIVRPDRYVAALVSDPSEFEQVTHHLLRHHNLVPLPQPRPERPRQE